MNTALYAEIQLISFDVTLYLNKQNLVFTQWLKEGKTGRTENDSNVELDKD